MRNQRFIGACFVRSLPAFDSGSLQGLASAAAVRDGLAPNGIRWPRLLAVFLCLCFAASCSKESDEPAPQFTQNPRVAKPGLQIAREKRIAEDRLVPATEESADEQETLPAPQSKKKAGKPGHKKSKGSRAENGDDVFAGTNVLRIHIQVSAADMNTLRGTQRMMRWGGSEEQRPTVRAKIIEGDHVYTNVALHLKGAAGSFREVDDNPCFTLNFQKFAPGQTFHGLHKLSLNNSVQDPSYLTEKICRELFEAAGVPAPRAGHAQVWLNQRDLGLRVLVEGFSRQFLKRHFTNTKGNLYDGGFLRDINQTLEVNSGDNPKDRSGLDALYKASREPDPAKRFEQLNKTLDMDRFISFVAMDIIQCDWDGYAMNRNNWRIFHDLDSNKMVFFPHGLDQMFGVERASPNCSILPHMQGLVARAVLSTPEGQRRYFARIGQLYTNVFDAKALCKRVDDLNAVIQPVIAQSSSEEGRYHLEAVQYLKQRIRQRDQSLKDQLSKVAARLNSGSPVQSALEPFDEDSGPRPFFFRRRY